MNHSITEFDRKYLAPKKRIEPKTNGYSDALFFIAVIVSIIIVADALCLVGWILSGQTPADGFYAGAITVKIISLLFNMTRTPEEILAEIATCNHLTDFAGVRRGDLIEFLPYEQAKEFLKEGVTEEAWKEIQKPATIEAIKAAVEDYMPFAWDKANNMRGLSAGRSINHMEAWVFMTADEEFMKKFAETEYEHYGKEKLIVVCEYFDLDYKQWDDGERTNG